MYNVRKIEENINMWGHFQGKILFDEDLAPRTTFKVGGKTPLFIEPENIDSFICALKALRKEHVPFFVLGGGSNIVVPDEGVTYPIISTGGLKSLTYDRQLQCVTCQAGVTIKELIDFCLANGLGGVENFAGLPGTIGGAVFMNARCYDVSISDVLISACYVDIDNPHNEIQQYVKKDVDWEYKVSPFQTFLKGKTILSGTFTVKVLSGDKIGESQALCQKYIEDRRTKGHFSYPSAGSVFKNNRSFGMPSGKIVDEVGLRGMQIGGAQVAPWHGNFIINTGHATAKDILQLTNSIIDKVFEKKGWKLETEIIFLPKIIVSENLS